MFKSVALALIVGFLGGCATLPDVTFTYYAPTWKATVVVTQTLGCDASKSRLVVLNTPTVGTTYFSDPEAPRPISITKLKSDFADSDMTITFYEDGRLKSINQSTTGQGEAIIKSAIMVVAAAAAVAAADTANDIATVCADVEKWGGGKPITLRSEADFGPSDVGKRLVFMEAPESKALYKLVNSQLPRLDGSVGAASKAKSGASYPAPSDRNSYGGVLLMLQDIGVVNVTVTAGPDPVGSAKVIIPLSTTYELPIPKPALFGKQTFTLALSEAGAITSIGYGKIDGAAGALNAIGAIAGAQTTADTAKAAAEKARADVIAQDQRIVLCESKPDQCK